MSVSTVSNISPFGRNTVNRNGIFISILPETRIGLDNRIKGSDPGSDVNCDTGTLKVTVDAFGLLDAKYRY